MTTRTNSIKEAKKRIIEELEKSSPKDGFEGWVQGSVVKDIKRWFLDLEQYTEETQYVLLTTRLLCFYGTGQERLFNIKCQSDLTCIKEELEQAECVREVRLNPYEKKIQALVTVC